MTTTAPKGTEQTEHRATVSAAHTIALPPEVLAGLGVIAGDQVEIRLLDGDRAVVRRAPSEPVPSAREALRDAFPSREAVDHFIDEERQGWDERDRELEPLRELLWERFASSKP